MATSRQTRTDRQLERKLNSIRFSLLCSHVVVFVVCFMALRCSTTLFGSHVDAVFAFEVASFSSQSAQNSACDSSSANSNLQTLIVTSLSDWFLCERACLSCSTKSRKRARKWPETREHPRRESTTRSQLNTVEQSLKLKDHNGRCIAHARKERQ